MKTISLIGISILLVSCGLKHNHAHLRINPHPANKFIEIIDYLNLKYSDSLFYDSNCKDLKLNKQIGLLLNMDVYNSLSHIMTAEYNGVEYLNQEAYRIGFYCYPQNLINMSGGVNEQWYEWQQSGNFVKSKDFITKIENSRNSIEKTVINECKQFLPKNKICKNVDVVLCFDGNRGCYTTGDIIVMDLLDFTSDSLNIFIHTVEHELHHIEYGDWLLGQYGREIKTDRQKAIFSFQSRIILEGIAQQFTYVDQNVQSKQLYNNADLLLELSRDWFNGLLGLAKTNDPLTYYKQYQSEMWGQSRERLLKYCIDEIEENTYPSRPTMDYYISFHLYNCIRQYGDSGLFMKVINAPELLLITYNEIWKPGFLIPKIPSEVVDIWRNNLIATPKKM